MINNDYKKIASAIQENTTSTHKLVKKDLIYDLCQVFKKDNPEFDAEWFRDRCRVYPQENL